MTFQLRIISEGINSQPSGPVPWIKYHPQWLCERLSDGRRARPPGRRIPERRQCTARRSSYQGSGSSKRRDTSTAPAGQGGGFAKGAVKEGVGKATGNERLREEGKLDKAKGDLYKTAGDVKDAVKKATG